ncbi:MAG: TonB-dependent siderophore receptor [Hyphomonadaceae bacterium]|nr:TonB-dependent siderophore receptor [Hyphomonadaceae bacterium]
MSRGTTKQGRKARARAAKAAGPRSGCSGCGGCAASGCATSAPPASHGAGGIRSFAKAALQVAALGVSTLALTTQVAGAQETFEERDYAQVSERITVTGQRRAADSPKYTAPLIDTPQTVTVVSSQIIQEQSLLNMRDILSTLPGITFGAGEGGGGYGDSINLRGYSANNDIMVDGVRDSAQYTRSDPFNLDQLELVSGANSVYSGSGSVGGSINLVTKRPSLDRNETVVNAGVGTDQYGRLTVDANRTLGENSGFRLNLMAHTNEVPGRDVEAFERWGAAPSLTLGLGADTSLTLLYVHQEDDNVPQYGVPYALGPFNNGPLPGVDPHDYFGYSNLDKQEITFDSATAILEHRFNDTFSLRNLTRWQRVSQLSIVDPPQGSWCVAPGIDPWTGAACAPGLTTGRYLPSGPRGGMRDTTNEIWINQADLTANFATGGLEHTLVLGVSYSEETYHLDTSNVLRNPRGVTPNPTLAVMDISNPDHIYRGPLNAIRTAYNDNEVPNAAVYAFDRIEIGAHWEINGGVRFERNEGSGQGFTIAVPYPVSGDPVVTAGPIAENEEDLFSYRAGVVYKPSETSSLYVVYGNSNTPSQSSVNGACAITGAAQNCNLEPEEATIYEIGGKWAVLDDQLLLTAAIFRNERNQFRVASGDPLVPVQQLDGQARVDGVALGAAGKFTEQWSIFANYSYLDSEIVQNISDIAIGGGAIDFQAGDPLPATPKHSGSIWTTYTTAGGITLGYGATYQGELTFARQSAARPLYYTQGYWVHRAMASYEVTENLAVQLNINNLTDEDYYERIRNNPTNGWATPGAARSAVLSLAYRF